MMLDYYIIEEYVDKVLANLNNIHSDKYYVKMAIAWAVSIVYIKFPKKCVNYLNNSNLDNFTYNKSIQKIIESYRVSEKNKELLRKMKK